MTKHFILIVEDHYELASTLCEFLEEHGFNGRLAFGLGGWSLGRGEIQLKTLKINQLFFT